MAIKVGINGFGRIGRVVARVCLQNCDLELSAINDPAISVDYISYLIKFDSTHGKLNGSVSYTDDKIIINDNPIKVFHEKQPTKIPWHIADVQYVIEASGMFTSLDKAYGHLESVSVKRVIVTSPSVDVPMIILGVNDDQLTIDEKVMSCASSTLYCLAPIIKILEDNFGVAEGFITSIHAMTPSLKPLDGLCLRGKHWRDHRSINQNIIPASTGACRALGKILPELKDKLTGMAFRVPIVNVSVLDLTVRLSKNTTVAEIIKCIETASRSTLKDIIKISTEQSVSSDFMGESYSCIFDAESTIQLKPDFLKIICWYENEYSYACRVADSIFFSEKQYCMLSSKITFVKPKFLLKQDFIQQTECYKKEISVSCCNTVASSVCKLPKDKNSHPSKQIVNITLPNSPSNLTLCSKEQYNDFLPWNDCDLGKPITNQKSRISVASYQPQLTVEKHLKSEVKKGKTTESSLKKSQSNHVNFSSSFKHELTKKPDQFRIKDKLFLAELEKLKKEPVEICGDGQTSVLTSQNKPIMLQTSTRIITKPKVPRSILITKYSTRKKRDTLLKQTAAKMAINETKNHSAEADSASDTITSLVERLAKNYRVHYLYNNGGKRTQRVNYINTLGISNKSTVSNTDDTADHKKEILNLDNEENHKEDNGEDKHVKLNDEELKKRNTIPIDNPFVSNKFSDENMSNLPTSQQNINYNRLEDTVFSTELRVVAPASESTSRCESSFTNTTASVKNSMKTDIYDKLDSASGSDSNTSFEVSKRKSQVIKISDLSNSIEDLERLDKICRIIEISDELSDKLFSTLDDDEGNSDEKKKKWSFKDLCEKIHLDEFCEKVFGKYAASNLTL